MNIVQALIRLLRDAGFETRYGTAYQINDYLTDVDFSQSRGETVAYMHLITSLSSVNGRERGEFSVYFARLCDFDFNGEDLLDVQEELKGYGEELIRAATCGNEVKVLGNARWQFGYDDFAENVFWACLRVTVESTTEECIPFGEGCEKTTPVPQAFRVETLPCSEISDTGFTMNIKIFNPEGKNITSRSVQYFVKGIGSVNSLIFGNTIYSSSINDYYQVRSQVVLTGEVYSVRGIVIADGVKYQGDWVDVKTGEYIPQTYTVNTLRYEINENTIRVYGSNDSRYTSFGFCYKQEGDDLYTQIRGQGSGSEFWADIEKKAGDWSFYAYSYNMPVIGRTRTLVRGDIIDFNI